VQRILAAATLVLLSAVAASAQTPSSPAAKKPAAPAASALPTVDQVLAHYTRALGGEQALRNLHSRVMKGTFQLQAQNITGSAELDMQSPDHFYSLVSIPDGGEHILVFDGKVAWSFDPQSGLREVTGKELVEMRRSSQFLYEWRLRALFAEVRVVEKTTEEDRPAWVLQATPAEGAPELFYFDTENGLLLRHDSTQTTADGEVPIEHRYSNYIVVDGVQVPSLLRHRDPVLEWQVKFSEIRHNVPINPAKFSKPVVQ
jgi:outer membrane lipoprotein-sorting protein